MVAVLLRLRAQQEPSPRRGSYPLVPGVHGRFPLLSVDHEVLQRLSRMLAASMLPDRILDGGCPGATTKIPYAPWAFGPLPERGSAAGGRLHSFLPADP